MKINSHHTKNESYETGLIRECKTGVEHVYFCNCVLCKILTFYNQNKYIFIIEVMQGVQIGLKPKIKNPKLKTVICPLLCQILYHD